MTRDHFAVVFLAFAILMFIDGVVVCALKRKPSLTPFAVALVCGLVFMILHQS